MCLSFDEKGVGFIVGEGREGFGGGDLGFEGVEVFNFHDGEVYVVGFLVGEGLGEEGRGVRGALGMVEFGEGGESDDSDTAKAKGDGLGSFGEDGAGFLDIFPISRSRFALDAKLALD